MKAARMLALSAITITSLALIASPGTTEASGLNGNGHASFHWEDARGDRTRYSSQFSFRNSEIDNSTFCTNYRRGSIEYRGCRKAAREWLQGQCRSDEHEGEWHEMYCFAGSSFRP